MVDFKTLRDAFKIDYPVSETPTQTDLLVFQLLRITQGNPVVAPVVSLPISGVIRLLNPIEGAEAVAGLPLELFATSKLPKTIGKVEFYAGNTKVGEDRTLPYSVTFTPTTLGALALRAVAISPDGVTQVSSEIVNINVVASPTPIPVNTPPTVTLVNPGSVTAGQSVTLTANASDSDGIAKVEFYQGAAKLGEDTSSPFNQSWTPAAGTYVLTAIAYDTKGLATTSASVNVTVAAATGGGTPTPIVSIANTTRRAGLINEALAVAANASITGDTLASVLFRADGSPIGTADTSSPYSVNYTPTTKGIKQISAVATGVLGGVATSANYQVQIFDSKVLGGGDGAGGASLAAESADFMLFDTNLAGGNATAMEISVGNVNNVIGVFNYDDTSYNGKPFAYFHAASNQLFIGTIGATVTF